MAKPDLLTVLVVLFSLGVFFTAMAPAVLEESESPQIQAIVSESSVAVN